MTRAISLLAFLFALLAARPVSAHARGEDYVFLAFRAAVIEGHFEIHEDDLREKLGVSISGSEAQALEALTAAAPRLREYLAQNFRIGPADGSPYTLGFTTFDVAEENRPGRFARLFFEIPIESLPDRIAFEHGLFYEDDKLHRGLLVVEYNDKTQEDYPDEYTAMVFSPTNREQVLDLNDVPSILGPWDMIPQGVHHIWIGLDHILFLLALMIPTVLRRREEGSWAPVEGFGEAFMNLLKIVTVFTIAHSVTLVLAALDFLTVPSRVVESIIALSIVLVAGNNLFGKFKDGSLWIILLLGLFHGMGFASVMGHLPFRMGQLLKIAVGFNIGVELGQVAIVAVVFPLLFLLRRSSLYQPLILRGGSLALIAIAGWWFVQRAFGLE